jgi:prepilin-type N-terminal cleavage/methylation domain-containing protein
MKSPGPSPEREAFTLLEMLVAMAVVGLMMAFMFNMVAQAIRTWEVGGRRMEGAQAARVGMNYIAQELQFAMAGVRSAPGNPTPNILNTITFVAIRNATAIPGGSSPNLVASAGSDQLFFVAPVGAVGSDRNPFGEVGYMNLFARSTGAYHMTGQRYYLVRHGFIAGGTNIDYSDFYNRGINTNISTNWINTPTVGNENRTPIVDNCIQLKFEYAVKKSDGGFNMTNSWTNRTNLPLGVLVTMRVLDTKSANRIAALRGDNPLTVQQLESLTNGQPSTDPVVGILREGTTTLRRFVPLLQSAPP